MHENHQNEKLQKVRRVASILFIVIVMLGAWHSDDAYHAYAMARNLANGHGFVYNIGERVNASTCPLFTLIVAGVYFCIRSMFISGLLVDIIFSCLAFYILIYRFSNSPQIVIGSTVVLSMSKCFISYTTSGLENPLLFFLSAVYLITFLRNEAYSNRQLFALSLTVGLIAWTRMDAALLFAIPSIYAFCCRRKEASFLKGIGIAIAGLMPFIIWEMFSLFYFGFFFPNTAYAKLQSGIPLRSYVARGVSYFAASGIYDVLVLFVPLLYILLAVKQKHRLHILLSAGIAIYYFYLLCIGGDFMAGRLLTIPFFISVCALVHLMRIEFNGKEFRSDKVTVSLSVVIGLLVIVTGSISFLYFGRMIVPEKLPLYHMGGVADERDYYFAKTSLINNLAFKIFSANRHRFDYLQLTWPEDEIKDKEAKGLPAVILHAAHGILVFYHNETIHLVDCYATGDPLLSKLPAVSDYIWRIGHLDREIPRGYEETLQTGVNCIQDPSLKAYYDKLTLITRGRLFDRQRIRAIVDMTAGRYNHWLEEYSAKMYKGRLLPQVNRRPGCR